MGPSPTWRSLVLAISRQNRVLAIIVSLEFWPRPISFNLIQTVWLLNLIWKIHGPGLDLDRKIQNLCPVRDVHGIGLGSWIRLDSLRSWSRLDELGSRVLASPGWILILALPGSFRHVGVVHSSGPDQVIHDPSPNMVVFEFLQWLSDLGPD